MIKINSLLAIGLLLFRCCQVLALDFGKDRVIRVVSQIAAEVALMGTPNGGCINDLSTLRRRLEEGSTSVFVLCPMSTFDLDGSEPLSLRSDTTILCGVDGSLSNSCIINGGTTHFVGNREIVNASVKGVTMVGASGTAVVLKHSGDVTFENCSFQNSRNVVLQIDYNPNLNDSISAVAVKEAVDNVNDFWETVKNWVPMDGLGRNLASETTPRGLSSVAETRSAGSRLAVRLAGCVFQGNNAVVSATQTNIGIISVDSSGVDLLIWDTLFLDNNYGSNLVRVQDVLLRDISFIEHRNAKRCFVL